MAAVQDIWLGLVVGNTRLHWGLFHGDRLTGGWHTPHLLPVTVAALCQQQFAPAAWGAAAAAIPPLPPGVPLPLWVASVVPSQTALWQTYPDFHAITLGDLPLGNLYPTLGIDRALNLVGAGDRYGWPILVIDAGTALTFTAGTAQGLIGGAILPGLAAQLTTLTQHTAALPPLSPRPTLPPRWATNTPDAIYSGVGYGLVATVRDFWQQWQQDYPPGTAVLTGGDSVVLWQWLGALAAPPLYHDPDLSFAGLARGRRQRLTTGR